MVFHGGKVFYNPRSSATDLDSILQEHGLTKLNILAALFRINGGKRGLYLANVREQKYYYCGTEWESVLAKLRELGIGRDEPMG